MTDDLAGNVEELSIRLHETMLATNLDDPHYLEKTIDLILTSVKDALHFNCAEFNLFRNVDGSIPKKGDIGPNPRLRKGLRLHWTTGVGYEESYMNDAKGAIYDIETSRRGPPHSLYDPKFGFEPLPLYDNEEDMNRLEGEGRIPVRFLERERKEIYETECSPADFPRGGFSEFVYQIYIPVTREISEGREMFGVMCVDTPLDIPLDQPPDAERMKAVLTMTRLAQAPLLTASMVDELRRKNEALKDAQDMIVRTQALAKYGEFSEQINHQINTLLLGITPAVDRLEEVNARYMSAVSKVASLNLSFEDNAAYASIRAFVSEHAADERVLTGLDLVRERKKARAVLSAAGITTDTLVEEYAAMQLPEETSDSLASLAKKYSAETVFSSVYSLFESRRVLNTIRESSVRIGALVAAVKDYSFGEKAQGYDVRKGIDSTLLVMEVKLGGVVVRRNYRDTALPIIDCYPGALDQVWTNIIDNALDAGAQTITIDARAGDGGVIAVSIANDGSEVPADALPYVFDKYFTTKKGDAKGKGLGLAIAKDIIERQHRGTIEAHSGSEEGDYR
jgi:signal transduction histidine kinase